MNEKDQASELPEVDPEVYSELRRELRHALKSALHEVDAHSLVCEQLYEHFDHYSWVGIYSLEGTELVLSAYSGPQETEHTRIAVGEGICGLAAETGETEIVPDVSERSEFIACFPSTRSEIVVPIHGPDGVLGEIDVDSDWRAAFDERDRELLEAIADDLVPIMMPGV